jgi:hypothetical protein
MTGRLRNDMEIRGRALILRYPLDICLEGMRKNMKTSGL